MTTSRRPPQGRQNHAAQAALPIEALVFIGRFQPFHAGHLFVVLQALARAPYAILIVGSSFGSISPRNAFTFAQIVEMIRASLSPDTNRRVIIRGVPDYYDDDSWIDGVQTAVASACDEVGLDPRKGVGLIGFAKDHTSYYLAKFPNLRPAVAADPFIGPDGTPFSATDIRRTWIHTPGEVADRFKGLLHEGALEVLDRLAGEPGREWLRGEDDYYRIGREKWAGAPYPPVHTLAEAVVVQAGHVLLALRGERPGKGLLCLPGNYLNPQMTLRQTAIGSVIRRTRISVPDRVLESRCSKTARVFDHPYRSERGRLVSHVYTIRLAEHPDGLPQLGSGGEAQWYTRAMLDPARFFEDSYQVVQSILDGADV